MTRELEIRPQAERDLMDASQWYERRGQGIGAKFIHAVDSALCRLILHPESGAHAFGVFRRILVSHFPFGIFYELKPDKIVVHAVLHLARDPVAIRRQLESDCL